MTAQTQKTIDGYDISKVTGDDVSGFMSGNREIIVYYTVNIDDGETPLDPGPGGNGSGDGDTDIGDGEVPLDPGTGNGGDGTDIGDENVPLVPATGDNLALWSWPLWSPLLAGVPHRHRQEARAGERLSFSERIEI